MTMGLVAQHITIKSHSCSVSGPGFIHPSALRAFVTLFSDCHPTHTHSQHPPPAPLATLFLCFSFNQRRLNRLPVVCLPLKLKQFQFNFSSDDDAPTTTLAPTGIFAFFCKKWNEDAGLGWYAVDWAGPREQEHCKQSVGSRAGERAKSSAVSGAVDKNYLPYRTLPLPRLRTLTWVYTTYSSWPATVNMLLWCKYQTCTSYSCWKNNSIILKHIRLYLKETQEL